MSVREQIRELTQPRPSHRPGKRHIQPDAAGSVLHPAERTKSPRVLLVEDDKALRRYLEVILEQEGYEVIQAADGLEGMKLALASTIDIVITDAMMPHLSGHEFCRFLRNSPSLSHIPIIILSGSEPQQGLTKKELADAFLSKPVSAAELTSCLQRLLRAAK